MLQADSSRSRQHARLTKRDQFVSSHPGLQSIHTGETKMISFKALAAAVLLSATAATPAFAQDRALYIKNLHDSGYNPKNDFNPNGTMRAAIQEPGRVRVLLSQSGRSEWRDANSCGQNVSRLARIEGGLCGDRRRHHLL